MSPKVSENGLLEVENGGVADERKMRGVADEMTTVEVEREKRNGPPNLLWSALCGL